MVSSNHVILKCGVCGLAKDPAWGGFCSCGASTWDVDQPNRRRGSADLGSARRLRTIEVKCELGALLRGFLRGRSVLLYGEAGFGKSTLAAAAAAAWRARFGAGSVWWLDGEQSKDLVGDLFRRQGLTAEGVQWYQSGPDSWEQQVSGAPVFRLYVIDSILAIGGASAPEQRRLVKALQQKAVTSICVQQVTQTGEMAGAASVRHQPDAVVRVEADVLTVEKSRWTGKACPFSVSRWRT